MQSKTLTSEDLARLVGVANSMNFQAVVEGLAAYGEEAGLFKPVNLVPYLAQLHHESMGFRYDREIWGPTAAQLRYEGRKDLGNIYAGDGSKFRGYTSIQITGRHNTTRFWEWCKANFRDVPNFVESPHLMNTDPWEGLGPIWYWDKGNPTNKSLNVYSEKGDFEMLTHRINGGLNGYADRCEAFTKIALAFLGYAAGDVRGYQRNTGYLAVDGMAGPATRSALHKSLVKLPAIHIEAKHSKPVSVNKPHSDAGANGTTDWPRWVMTLINIFFKKD